MSEDMLTTPYLIISCFLEVGWVWGTSGLNQTPAPIVSAMLDTLEGPNSEASKE